jgi:hypothetical protein
MFFVPGSGYRNFEVLLVYLDFDQDALFPKQPDLGSGINI